MKSTNPIYDLAVETEHLIWTRHGCGWMDGGCLIFAQALARYLMPHATLSQLVYHDPDYGPFADHMVVTVDCHGRTWVIDAHGIHDSESFPQHWARTERRMARSAARLSIEPGFDENMLHCEALTRHVVCELSLLFGKPSKILDLIPVPAVMTEEEFLCGADSADPWCVQHFDDYIRDIDIRYEAEDLQVLSSPDIPEGYAVAESSDSVLLVDTSSGEVVGYYNAPGAVCLREDVQGLGLGSELILETWKLLGHPPTEGLDEQMFSESGLAAHRAAYRSGVERGYFSPRPAAPSPKLT